MADSLDRVNNHTFMHGIYNNYVTMQDDHYVVVCEDRHIDVRPQHQCTTKREVSIQCIDEFGKSIIIIFFISPSFSLIASLRNGA